ncbi:MAG: DUF86 domain-containing protein [Bacteroidales bacterium]|nr:DUF86 domain-containing protein [Bacteroidales bacterium]
MRNRVIHGYDKIDDEIIWGDSYSTFTDFKRRDYYTY